MMRRNINMRRIRMRMMRRITVRMMAKNLRRLTRERW
jgi:hypothetical protein